MDPFFITSDNLIADRRFGWARDLQAKAYLAAEVQLQALELGATLILPHMTVVRGNLRPEFLSLDSVTTRTEKKVPVPGLIIVASR